ncbi:MAG: YicC/YloC family endoribonuclease [Roseovarius sp.]
MLQSMTGYASAQGTAHGFSWSWELRAVNGKGLDLRLRVPDWIDGLEAQLRKDLSAALSRGNVSLSLKIQSDEQASGMVLNQSQLSLVLQALADVEQQAMDQGLSLAPANAAHILGLRGVLDHASAETDTAQLNKTLIADFAPVLASFCDMRATEGAALATVLLGQLDQIEVLTTQAADMARARAPDVAAHLKATLAKVMDAADGADEARVAQELALLAVKADVTEEIDRLHAHITAARDLVAKGSPIGRKLDFLSQEFNREANTLCSKAQNTGLTTLGIELKTLIDQMREQVQNVE